MPHCTLEYSANIVDQVDFGTLFADLHQSLMEFETFPMADIKSRAVRLDHYYIGDGNPQNAYVHLKFSLLTGRDISVRQRIVQACLRVLTNYFTKSIANMHCQVTVEVREMDRSTYVKHKPEAPPA